MKTKIIELLYSWTLALPEESKIKDAYHMLKRQGIVQSDPLIPMDRTLIPSPPPRPKNPVFDDEEKSKVQRTPACRESSDEVSLGAAGNSTSSGVSPGGPLPFPSPLIPSSSSF